MTHCKKRKEKGGKKLKRSKFGDTPSIERPNESPTKLKE
jgi:hypothetical protein